MNITLELTNDEWNTFNQKNSTEQAISGFANQLLKEAVKAGLKPFLTNTKTDSAASIRVLSTVEIKVAKHMQKLGYRFSENPRMYINGLIRAVLMPRESEASMVDKTDSQTDSIDTFIDDFFARSDKVVRPLQRQLIHQLIDQCRQGKIGLNEASTGIGKTAAMLCAAEYLTEHCDFDSVVIATPTNVLVNQLISASQQYQSQQSQAKKLVSPSDYISLSSIEYEIANANVPNVIEILEKVKKDCGDRLSYRIDELDLKLLTAIQGLNLAITCDKNTPNDDPGHIEYREHSESYTISKTVCTTHSRLAIESYKSLYSTNGIVKQCTERGQNVSFKTYQSKMAPNKRIGISIPHYEQWFHQSLTAMSRERLFNSQSILPLVYDSKLRLGVFIDEAHQLADQVELANSQSVSIDLFLKRLHSVSDRKLKPCCERIIEKMYTINNLSAKIPSKTISSILSEVQSDLNELLDFNISRRGLVVQLELNRLKTTAKSLLSMNDSYQQSRLIFSKVKNNVSIQTKGNPFDSFTILSMIYAGYHSASYLSGTLNDESNQYSYSSGMLRIPNASSNLDYDVTKERSLTAPWLTEKVTLTVNANFDDNTSRESLLAKARCIHHHAQKNGGGTLILCNSFEEAQTLEHEFASLGGIASVCDKRNDKSRIEKYKALYHEFGKAAYFATGSAWVGMDVTDTEVEPENDHLIKTLVMTRAPFESLSKQGHSDIDKYEWYRYLSATIVKFRQGLGRLVRRPGREGMHVLYLDALYNKKSRSVFKKILLNTFSK